MPVDSRGDMVPVADLPSRECPRCHHPMVDYLLDCHTYGDGRGGFSSCWGCATAVEYFCLCAFSDPGTECKCNWRYVEGLNPENPRSESNEKRRPEWLDDADDKEAADG